MAITDIAMNFKGQNKFWFNSGVLLHEDRMSF